MNSIVSNIYFRLLLLAIGIATLAIPDNAHALPLTSYTQNSVLSDGNWVKVSVSETGIHMIPVSTLKNWGFSDPSKVKVYGYGGKRLRDLLNSSTYIDDLPITQSVTTNKGLYFYAQGPVDWTKSGDQYTHSLNPFSSVGYYYLTDKETDNIELEKIGSTPNISDDGYASTFTERLYHEKDLFSPGETGHLLVGEDFKYNNTQNFTFDLIDKASPTVWMQCAFVSKTFSAPAYLQFSANGTQLNSSNDYIKTSVNNSYTHGTEAKITKQFDVATDKLTLGITYKTSVTIHLARLNNISINYDRNIRLNNGKLIFRSDVSKVKLANATQTTRVWDVTSITNIKELNTTLSGDNLYWHNDYTGLREYVAWDENGSFPSPVFVNKTANQNIHAEEVPDMVIFTIGQWLAQAERIADLHRFSSDSLKVLVIDQEHAFNEFSSGLPDVNALRKTLKMFWDRGNNGDRTLKYALLFGRGTYDHRKLTGSISYPIMPIWQTDAGLDDNETYCTDDIIAFLQDNSGVNLSSDKLSIAIGRIPVRSEKEAKASVDKLYKYVNNSLADQWKNQILLLADDDDSGSHMTQTETMFRNMINSTSGDQFFYNKTYIDAFELTNGQYPDARTQMFRLLDEGVMWWNYIGHASTTSLSHEGMLTYTDINNLYLKRFPVFYAATCDFLRWDGNSLCGAEILFQNNNGGIIAAISAVRPVFIAENGLLSANLSKFVFERDKNGNFLPLGEILRYGKNEFKNANSNKLRYTLLGDPAMRFTSPKQTIALETINNQPVILDNQVTIRASQDVTLKGSIYDALGNKMTQFNGVISATMYDAEKSTTTNGNGAKGEKITFEEQGGKLYMGRDSIKNGEFTLNVSMPSEITHNFRQAALNMFAVSNDGIEAIGCNRDFYVYGYADVVEIDTTPPTISAFFLNHESFKSGDKINESPMAIAYISDNKGINLSQAGIGHQMTLTIDGSKSYTDVSQYYTPDASGQVAGTITYPLENLTEGNHSLKLRIWDTSGNSTEQTIDFFVEQGLTPKIYDVYSDANPASVEANFYITHNRPDAMMTVTLNVYNLLGRLEWSTTITGQSDMFKSFPITWDLCDMSGRRVPRGIYVYKAAISTDGAQFDTATKKIAVTAQ